MSHVQRSTGLEGAPDIMLLTMAALMVAVVWLVSHVHERTLPPIELPSANEAELGVGAAASLNLTLRPTAAGGVEIWLEDKRVAGGLDALEAALASAGAASLTLRADADTRWEDALAAMNAAARLDLEISVAAKP